MIFVHVDNLLKMKNSGQMIIETQNKNSWQKQGYQIKYSCKTIVHIQHLVFAWRKASAPDFPLVHTIRLTN